MKELANIILPDDRMYTNEHIWIKQIEDVYYVGVSDFAQDQLGEVVYVDLPSIGDSFSKDDSFGEVESIKSVNKLFMPVDGEIININTDLEESSSLVNASCYEKAWIIQIKILEAQSLNTLMNADQYREFLAK